MVQESGKGGSPLSSHAFCMTLILSLTISMAIDIIQP